VAIEGVLIGLALSVGATAGGGWWCLRRLAQARHLLDTPTSKIRSAAQGYAEFYGVLQPQPDSLIVAPLSGKPCLWWRFKIEEYQADDKKRSWRVLESGSCESWLQLDDGTGHCLINPRGAEVRPSTREVWQGHLRHPRGPAKSGWQGLLSSGKRYRYTEERLHAGQPYLKRLILAGASPAGLSCAWRWRRFGCAPAQTASIARQLCVTLRES
jgi:hypothetical protein